LGEAGRDGNAVFSTFGFMGNLALARNVGYKLPMALSNLTVAEEALSLSPEDRAALARLLIQSLESDSRTDVEIKAELNSRLEQLLSKKDPGLGFHEVFGVPS
jgi:putative addiction module component (TIGR02574 family)